ncbi:MAG: hypothetical protein QOG44_2515, partial [Acidimicrobiaceae bacterium]|nr:hypothetical protein [Acidimicrobiaceae bacterium]
MIGVLTATLWGQAAPATTTTTAPACVVSPSGAV